MNIRPDAPKNHIPGINFLEFLVHAFSVQTIMADRESAKHACTSHIVSAENTVSLFIGKLYLIWLLTIIQLKYKTNLNVS